MFKSYLIIGLRNLRKHISFFALNTIGLALGLACFILIMQYISFEKSMNGFHSNLPNLYRMLYEVSYEGKTFTWSQVPPGLSTQCKDEFGEIKAACRVAEGNGNGIVTYDNGKELKSYREESVVYADGNFFDVFSFPVVSGPASALTKPNTVALSESSVKKYFASENPIGETITLNNQFGKTLYTVDIVFADFPANSDLQFDMIFSLQTLANPSNLNGNEWAALDNLSSQYINTFFLLADRADFKDLENKINSMKRKLRPDDMEVVRLQPLNNMHLAGSINDYYTTYGNLRFIYLFSVIAAMILIIAWFNYINLSTASALKRAKEVGLRKVIGATRKQLIFQFMGESFILNFMALIVSLGLVQLLQLIFNQLAKMPLSLSILFENSSWIGGLAFLIVGSIASGAYTAFALSSYKPSQTLKGIFSRSERGVFLRKTMVVFQFSVSLFMITSTAILYQQLNFMQNQDLGMKLEQLLVIRAPDVGRDETYQKRNVSFQNLLGQQSYIQQYCNSGSVPGNFYNFSTNGITRLNPQPNDDQLNYSFAIIDDKFLKTYSISLLAGKNFTPEMCSRPWREMDKLLMNEKAAMQMGFGNPVNAVDQKVIWEGKEYEVIGVVKDYHHMALQRTIDPVVFVPQNNGNYFTVNLTTEDLQAKVASLEKIYKTSFPGNPFDYFFVDDRFNEQYSKELHYGYVFTGASVLAIFIACLGLFGLALFTVEQRTKEIGIRKVFGAPVVSIVQLLSKDFIKLVIIAILIASPVTWWTAKEWLQDFPYQVELSVGVFAAAGLVALVIAAATISVQSIRSATANPIDSLRNE